MTDDRLQHLLAIVPPHCIVLLEDIDWAIRNTQTEPETSGPYQGMMRVTFSGLLNALDGVVATEERLVFMTTNNPERLPPVLVRPGRIDLKIRIGLATEDQIRKMFMRFYPGSEELADQFVEGVRYFCLLSF